MLFDSGREGERGRDVRGRARRIVEEAVIDDQLDIVAKLLSHRIGAAITLGAHRTQILGSLTILG